MDQNQSASAPRGYLRATRKQETITSSGSEHGLAVDVDDIIFKQYATVGGGEFIPVLLDQPGGPALDISLADFPVDFQNNLFDGDFEKDSAMSTDQNSVEADVVAKGRKRQQQGRMLSEDQRKRMNERQRKYREKKKTEQERQEKDMAEKKQKIAHLKKMNVWLEKQNDGLAQTISYANEIFDNHLARRTVPGSCLKEEQCKKKSDDGISAMEVNEMFEWVTEKLSLPDEHQLARIAVTVKSDRELYERKTAYCQFQRRVSSLSMMWCSDEKRDSADAKMRMLMQARMHIANYLISVDPDFVLARFTDGWVSTTYCEGPTCPDPLRLSDEVLESLLDSINWTPEQAAQMKRVSDDFMMAWKDIKRTFIRQICIDQIGNSDERLEVNGLQGFMDGLLKDGSVCVMLSQINKKQLKCIVGLCAKVLNIIEPIQIAKLTTFVPGVGPNILFLANYLSHGSSTSCHAAHNQMKAIGGPQDKGHLVM